jgi:hypothetical protein
LLEAQGDPNDRRNIANARTQAADVRRQHAEANLPPRPEEKEQE